VGLVGRCGWGFKFMNMNLVNRWCAAAGSRDGFFCRQGTVMDSSPCLTPSCSPGSCTRSLSQGGGWRRRPAQGLAQQRRHHL